ncbi:MAG: leucyl aminopeptidase family protein [Haliscomenobacter sp.]|uniref:leucyl aminopeptidase family protein n=1 Tax=Haliscomenobacter sp. TaxID=2717303 RepID=UPI0029AE1FF2|nr:leucyl aminopeptidase family protein [Haliscomenobacter sp.]MDX2068862.1 leucyl aminopeptidase family protein [Haliscomenobacter sp.]
MKINWQSGWVAGAQQLLIPVSNNQGEWIQNLEHIGTQIGVSFKAALEDFKAETGETTVLYGPDCKVFLLGLGREVNFAEVLRAARLFAARQKSKLSTSLGIYLDAALLPADQHIVCIEAMVNGLYLGTYDAGKYKSKSTETHPLATEDAAIEFYLPASVSAKAVAKAVAQGQVIAEAQLGIYDLINAPGNKKQPAHLASFARAAAQRGNFSVRVLEKAELEAEGFYALLGVNQGSAAPPVCIVMEYVPTQEATRTIGLVGKGVTFDTGGISIKPSANMHHMKSDMSGAAAVYGAIEVAARLELPFHLIGITPVTENSVDADSLKPGDVIDSYSGRTIEVTDTDAEGRIILADALSYLVRNYKVDSIVDLATLTGSAARVLGAHAACLFANDDQLAESLALAGEYSGERLWRLPLWDVYKDELKSDVADLRNFSGKPAAGAISAAKFLEVFVDEHPSWAHLDIAGVAYGDVDFLPHKSATAFGVRLLVEWLMGQGDA